MTNPNRRRERWRPAPRPEWLARVIAEGAALDLPGVVPLDEGSLLESARQATGLDDFGPDDWREGFRVYIGSLEREARLHLMGRLLMRSDLLGLLENRLRIREVFARSPEIAGERIESPMFITGLARSGTSILFEILAQDPACAAPASWEVMFPCPPPEASSHANDPRIEKADLRLTLWNRIAPEYATMHEMGGRIPAECLAIFCHSFRSSHLSALAPVPGYDAWLAGADPYPAYAYHRRFLQLLQWRNPRERWLLKSPPHIDSLDVLLRVYPDARIVQTHRDPVKAMDSVADLLGTIYHMRSERPFDATGLDAHMLVEGCAARLERVMEQRRAGIVPGARIFDVLYHELVDDPLGVVARLYEHFGMQLTREAARRMRAYVDAKPKGRFGEHVYAGTPHDEIRQERARLRRYQEYYGVRDEA